MPTFDLNNLRFQGDEERAVIEQFRRKVTDVIGRHLTPAEAREVTVKLSGTSLENLQLQLVGPDIIIDKIRDKIN